jgi:hypothetical protein
VERQVLEAMVADLMRNPFWEARYGEKGRRATRQDAGHNLKHLVTAIAVDNPASLADYYRWLRGLLVYRGMCSLHLRQTLDVTGQYLGAALPSHWKYLSAYHNASYQGLDYDQPAAAALQEQAAEIAIATTTRLFSPARLARIHTSGTETERTACLRDNQYHLSYLADALEMQAPQIFEEYITFLIGFLPAMGVPVSSLQESLRIMGEEIYYSLPSDTYPPILAMLDQAIPILKTA